jgi:hypothetical protein
VLLWRVERDMAARERAGQQVGGLGFAHKCADGACIGMRQERAVHGWALAHHPLLPQDSAGSCCEEQAWLLRLGPQASALQ